MWRVPAVANADATIVAALILVVGPVLVAWLTAAVAWLARISRQQRQHGFLIRAIIRRHDTAEARLERHERRLEQLERDQRGR